MGAIGSSLEDFRAEAEGYAGYVDSEIADRQNDFRSMCFWNIRNRIAVTEEIVGFYGRCWENTEVPEEAEAEVNERIVTVTKDMFVDIVSSVEKASKDCVSVYTDSGLRERAMQGRTYLYLRNIVEASAALGYIQEDVMAEWDDILTLRNLVTHNNSVSDRSKVCEVGGIRISMRPGRMMKGPPDTFIVLSREVTRLFYDWLRDVHGMFS